ncbi:MAG: hypothetical protein WA110_08255, partial [Anaerolineaceae bacterium]
MEKLFRNSSKQCLNTSFRCALINQCTPYGNQNIEGVLFRGAHRSTWGFWQYYLNIPISFVQTKRVSSGLARLYEISLASYY